MDMDDELLNKQKEFEQLSKKQIATFLDFLPFKAFGGEDRVVEVYTKNGKRIKVTVLALVEALRSALKREEMDAP